MHPRDVVVQANGGSPGTQEPRASDGFCGPSQQQIASAGVVVAGHLPPVLRRFSPYRSHATPDGMLLPGEHRLRPLRRRESPEVQPVPPLPTLHMDPPAYKVLLVDHVRAQLSLVKNLADMVSFMLGPSLLYAYAYSVFLLCASAYYTTVAELPFRVRLFFFFFFTLHWFSILVPPVEVHRMRNAVTELRSVVQCVPTADYSDDLLVQLRMLLYAIKHDDLKFTGCGFFTVDLSTFAGITGAVITCTVVLAQTSESYFRDTLVHSSSITAA
ncbi:uncharacterized protein LOC142564943 [Dermacentor variabilis]|uniref:uncharacterized protein LOC142564943 n=1 Tax=Dermacentor variabilis TaxID=34621 RepID=UPI003F5C0B08